MANPIYAYKGYVYIVQDERHYMKCLRTLVKYELKSNLTFDEFKEKVDNWLSDW